jgi:hypothetical protein
MTPSSLKEVFLTYSKLPSRANIIFIDEWPRESYIFVAKQELIVDQIEHISN